MTRKRWSYTASVIAVALVAVVGLQTVAQLDPVAGSPVAKSPGVGIEKTRIANQSAPAGTTLPASARRMEPANKARHAKVDIARVEAALARVQATTAKFTQAQLADEQRKMLEAKARFEAVKITEPTTRKFTDPTGLRWIELQHESGEIRYQLDPDEPASGSDPAR